MEKIRLDVLGISYSQTQSGAYALILGEMNGKRRIPIIIGSFEAQSIAIQLEKLKPPRPLTHDLFLQVCQAYGIRLTEVLIYKLEEGIFYSKMMLTDGTRELEFDTRTSDAIAMAIRFNCPIFIDNSIIDVAGILFEIEPGQEENPETQMKPDAPRPRKQGKGKDFEALSLSEMKTLLNEAVNNEDYEKASLLRDEINKRTNK